VEDQSQQVQQQTVFLLNAELGASDGLGQGGALLPLVGQALLHRLRRGWLTSRAAVKEGLPKEGMICRMSCFVSNFIHPMMRLMLRKWLLGMFTSYLIAVLR
jgi:hypothetical protein